MVLNIAGTARNLEFSGVESTPGKAIARKLPDYVAAYNAATGATHTGGPGDPLTADAREWIAARSLLGDPEGQVLLLPVVNPDTDCLNREALEAIVLGSGAAQARARDAAQALLDSEFKQPGNQAPLTKAVINSRTTGAPQRKVANGRDHVVVGMVPIVGDTVMNSILYPDDEVHKSFEQLADLPAPAGHPEVNGKRVSAYHPMAVNAHNIGGIVRNPTKKGRQVRAEFWLDEIIANASDDGRETLRRINEGEEVGVSTGLNLRLVNGQGVAPDGQSYTAVGHDFTFDHVAVLLNDIAAGAHAGTALVTNSEGEDIIVATVDNVTASELHEQIETAIRRRVGLHFPEGEAPWVWIRDIDIDESFVVYTQSDKDTEASRIFRVRFARTDTGVDILGDPQEVLQVTTYTPVAEREPGKQEGKTMELTIEKVTEFLQGLGQVAVNAAEQTALQEYLVEKPAFDAWAANEATRLAEKRGKLVEASELTAEMVANIEEPTIDKLLTMSEKRTPADYRLRGGGGGGAGGGEGDTVTTNDCQAVIDGPVKKGE